MELTQTTSNSQVNEIKRRSLFGIVALTSRTFALQVIALVATFILTILLDPAAFGIFFVVTAAVNFLNYFSDIGLAAALIQKKEEPTRDDLVTTFTIQQLLVITAVIFAYLSSGKIAGFYHIGNNGLFLFRALVISFLLSSLKTIPSVLLERKLKFDKLIIPQIAETTAFYIIAIILAIEGKGIASFAWAALVRGVVGTTLLYIIAPWKPGFAIKKESAEHLLSFGLPYQANSFLALIKDDLMTVFLGKILPFAQVGYIGWAKKWAEIALRLIMDNVIKVTFPAYSRLQHDKELLSIAIHKSLQLLSLLALPIAIGMLFMVKPFIDIIPKYSKWEPALFSFYLFTISSVLAALSSPLVNTLNALGKVKYTFYLMLVWTGLTWILIPLFIKFFGFNGVSIAAAVIGLTSFMPLVFINRIVKVNLFKNIAKPILATILMAATLLVMRLAAPNHLMQLIFGIISGSAVYLVLIWAMMKEELLPYWEILKGKKD